MIIKAEEIFELAGGCLSCKKQNAKKYSAKRNERRKEINKGVGCQTNFLLKVGRTSNGSKINDPNDLSGIGMQGLFRHPAYDSCVTCIVNVSRAYLCLTQSTVAPVHILRYISESSTCQGRIVIPKASSDATPTLLEVNLVTGDRTPVDSVEHSKLTEKMTRVCYATFAVSPSRNQALPGTFDSLLGVRSTTGTPNLACTCFFLYFFLPCTNRCEQ